VVEDNNANDFRDRQSIFSNRASLRPLIPLLRGSRLETAHARVALDGPECCPCRVLTLFAAAPFFMMFEIWQLVLSERYLGVKQIARGADPRTLGLHEVTAFFWSTLLIGYWLWMLMLLFAPFGRMYGGGLLLIWMLGFSLRRGVRFKWVLVILTFEGALRIAILMLLSAMVWRRFL
jgi:hypothetical protein